MKYRKLIIIFIVGLISTFIVISCSSGGSSESGSTPPPVADTTAPISTAIVGSGIYGSVQYITLQSNEPAIIYYSIDGNDPFVDGVNTISGSNPITDIEISSDTTLKFFSIDSVGNQEIVKSESYTIDLTAPTITLNSSAPGLFGLLTSSTLVWQSDEEGDYIVELGGTGTSGTGEVLASGHISDATPVMQEINGTQLSFVATTPLWIYLTDSVGHTGVFSLDLYMKPRTQILFNAGSWDIELFSNGLKVYIPATGVNLVSLIDTNLSSPTLHNVIGAIPVGIRPFAIKLTPDNTKAYVTNSGGTIEDMDSVSAIDVASGTVLDTINLGPEVAPNGIDITPDATRAYFLTFEGDIKVLDIDPGSGTYHTVIDTIAKPWILFGKVAITSDGTKAIVNWQGSNSNGLDIIDVNSSSPTYNTIIGTPIPVVSGSGFGGGISLTADSNIAFVSTPSYKLSKVDLKTSSIIESFTEVNFSGAIALTPDEQTLVAIGTNGRIYSFKASTLSLIGDIDLQIGASDMVITPDGERAYIVSASDKNVTMIYLK